MWGVREFAGEKIEEKGQGKSGHFDACILANVFPNAAIRVSQYISKRVLEIHSKCCWGINKKKKTQTQNHGPFSTATSKQTYPFSKLLVPRNGKRDWVLSKSLGQSVNPGSSVWRRMPALSRAALHSTCADLLRGNTREGVGAGSPHAPSLITKRCKQQIVRQSPEKLHTWKQLGNGTI